MRPFQLRTARQPAPRPAPGRRHRLRARQRASPAIDALEMFYHVAKIGDARSLAIHPATTTHSQLDPHELDATGLTDGYVRLPVGIEQGDPIAPIGRCGRGTFPMARAQSQKIFAARLNDEIRRRRPLAMPHGAICPRNWEMELDLSRRSRQLLRRPRHRRNQPSRPPPARPQQSGTALPRSSITALQVCVSIVTAAVAHSGP